MKNKRFGRSAVIIALLVLFGAGSSWAASKTYWHFTVKAFVDLPDTNGVEWAWITMVEYDAPGPILPRLKSPLNTEES